jgi:DNA-binding NarL/FixJ family response regulator
MSLDIAPRVLVADDHELVRIGLERLLHDAGGLSVVGSCDQLDRLEALIDEHDPDVLVLDLQFPEGSALDRIPGLVARWPHLAVLVLSMHDRRVYAERCLRLGARGFLMKEDAAAQVVAAVRAVATGQTWGAAADAPAPSVAQLTDRELQIFECIGDGQSTRVIAARLGLSDRTVEAHKGNIKRRLGLASATELGRQAMAWRGGQVGGTR